MNFLTIFKEQACLHPSMLPCDAMKLCYQAAFGAEHLLLDANAAREYFDAEFLSVPEGDLRSEERLLQPGGNVHYERFLSEVAPNLSSGKSFSYRMFDCSEMRMGGIRQVCQSPWRIVEGTYSCHPALENYMDLRIFCDVRPGEQLQRIRKRNGVGMASVFESRWIPMEELYFDTYRIEEKADMVLSPVHQKSGDMYCRG